MTADPNSISVCGFKLGPDRYLDIFELIPGKSSASIYISIGLLVFSMFFLLSVFRRWTNDPHTLLVVEYITEASVLFVAFWTYVKFYNNLDEVAVNLEHSFNLFHFGRFSMSPNSMVDGTVEYFYYLLLTPFAADPPTLVFANFILGFLILCAHLLLVKDICKTLKPEFFWPIFGIFIVAYYPFVSILADGFGNGLISLIILFAISNVVKGRINIGLRATAVLPLIRPDGVLFSAALGLSLFVSRYISWKQLICCALGSGAALGVYFLAHRISFDHAIPTPIIFKSVPLSLLSVESLVVIWPFLERWATSYSHSVTLTALLFLILWPKKGLTANGKLGICLTILLIPIMVWFIISNQTHSSYLGDSISRYWIGMETALIFASLYLALSVPRYLSYPLLFIAAVYCSFDLGTSHWISNWSNRKVLAMAGEIVDRITPGQFKIASSEMNGFGFGIAEKDVIDFWGYSNPEIAASQVCNQFEQKVSPGLFNRLDPDIFFIYTAIPPSEAVKKVLNYDHFSLGRNLLGDLNIALSNRSFITFDLPGGYRFSLLVANRRKDEIVNSIRSILHVVDEKCSTFKLAELAEDYVYPGDDSAYQQCSQVSLKVLQARWPMMIY